MNSQALDALTVKLGKQFLGNSAEEKFQQNTGIFDPEKTKISALYGQFYGKHFWRFSVKGGEGVTPY